MIYPHRQRAEIVKAGDFDFAGVDGVENAWHQADTGAVAQFSMLETQIPDLAQHAPAIGMPMGIPAGRKRIHKRTRPD